MTLLLLFYEFFKTGLFSVGGGLATIPFLTAMIEKYGWITQTELTNIIAVAESTPGPIGINAATYVGYAAAGVAGAAVATLSLILPSVIIIVLIARFMSKFSQTRIVKDLFTGLRPVSAGLVMAAGFSILLLALNVKWSFAPFQLEIGWTELGIFALLLIGLSVKPTKKLHPVVYIVVGGLMGALLSL